MKKILYFALTITIFIHSVTGEFANSESDFSEHILKAQCLIRCYQNCNASVPKFDDRSHLVKGSRCEGNQTCDLTYLSLCNLTKEDHRQSSSAAAVTPSPIYHCTFRNKSSTLVYFRWEYSNSYLTTGKYLSELPPNLIPRAFLIHLKTNDDGWEFHSIQTDWLVPFNLTPGNSYNIRITPVSPEAVYQPQISGPIRIYHTTEIKPTVSKSIRMERVMNGEPTRLKGSTRNFRFYFESGAGTNASCSNEYALNKLSPESIRRSITPERAFYFGFQDFLKFGSNQTVFVREALTTNFDEVRQNIMSSDNQMRKLVAKPVKPLDHKVEYTMKTFQIPSCYEFHNYSFDECAPPHITDFEVHELPEGPLQLRWGPPKYVSEINRIEAYTTWACKTTNRTEAPTCVDCWLSSIWKSSLEEISTDKGFARNVSLIDNDTGGLLFCLTAIATGGISPPSNITYYRDHGQERPQQGQSPTPATITISSGAWSALPEYSRKAVFILSLGVLSSYHQHLFILLDH